MRVLLRDPSRKAEAMMAPGAALERVDVATGARRKLPGAVQWSSDALWRGIRLEHRSGGPGEVSEGYLLKHLIALKLGSAVTRELYLPERGWKLQRIAAGAVQVFPARVPYALRWSVGWEALVLEIAPEFVASVACSEWPQERVELRAFVAAEDRFISETMRALEADLLAGSPAGRLYGESLGMALAAHLVRRYTDIAKDEHGDSALSKQMLSLVLHYIEDNLETDLSLQHLADLVHMDLYRFLRSFKRSTGLPPHQYILSARVERAKSLLRNPALALTEVALRSGFASQTHFATAFRRITHMTPRTYRNATA
jgi:AraC family transcriptional regulator